ncbi:MAG: nucleotidyltransferase [Candidatus Adiutrix sp.]|jgi:hypothetical protein|nr:nucleotidyltransferase [Candidatus Adiutrix sp.]
MPKRDEILQALEAIGRRLAADGKKGHILIAGGASMCLVHSARETTEDVDALYEPRNDIMLHSFEVGEKFGWEPGWLNQGVRAFMDEDVPSELFVSFPGLQVFTVTPEYLLSMKLKAGRSGTSDFSDARFLIKKLGLKSVEEALAVVGKYLEPDQLTTQAKLTLKEMFRQKE